MNPETLSLKPISRRNFLKLGLIATAAAGVSACSGTTPASIAVEKPAVELKSFTFEENPINGRVLVAYASGTGSTVDIAAAIGETLSNHGYAVDVRPVKDNPSPDGYQAVVIGSAVNGAKWLPEARAYVETHQQALNRLPLALFCVHIMNTGDDEKSRSNRLAYLDNIRAMLQPSSEGYFAGIGMNADKESALVRWVYRTFKIGLEGDCRDWDKIGDWADSLEGSLS